MLKRYWVVIASLGLTIVTLFAGVLAYYGQPNNGSSGYAAEQEAYQREVSTETCPNSLSLQDRLACVRDEFTSRDEDNRERQDLTAQQNMARFAYWLLIATIALGVLGLLLNGVGVWLVLGSLGEARRVSRLAISANRVANKANRTTEQIGQAQVRAYVSCISGTFTVYNGGLVLTLQIKNTGQSPTQACTLTAQAYSRRAGIADVTSYSRPVSSQTYSLAAGEERSMYLYFQPDDITPAMLAAFRDTGSPTSAECGLSWRDVFRREQVLPFFVMGLGLLETGKDGTSIRKGELNVSNRRPPETGQA